MKFIIRQSKIQNLKSKIVMKLLEPYRVLDLTGPLGFLTGKILADLGADVIKIEPPGGDPARRLPPLLGSESLFWLAHNVNKRSVTLDIHSDAGRELFLRLVATSDFVLESSQPGALEVLGLGYDTLSKDNPVLIVVSITPFGQQGPYIDFQASDLEIMAASGAMSLAGEKDCEPMRITAPQAPMWVGAEAAMGALTALAHRAVTGKGQRVDVSAQAAVISALAHAPAFWDIGRINPERDGIYVTGRSLNGARMRVFWPCRDGWINFIIYGGSAGRHTNQQLVAWMDESRMAPEWLKQIDWNLFDITIVKQDEIEKLEAPIFEFFSTLTKQEFLDGAIKRKMLGYPVSTVEDITNDQQLKARGFWQEVAGAADGEALKYPGGFAVINGERLRIQRPAPQAGEHNREIFVEELGLDESDKTWRTITSSGAS
jgi:crotonobetainyl-CoA:carnitine CoA-transferase CaiB-like acyl-CoA transferase